MTKIITFLQGKKTYFLAVLYGLCAVLYYLKVLDDNTYLILKGLLEGGMGITIAAKINRKKYGGTV